MLISVQKPCLQMPHGLKHSYIWIHFVVTNFLSPHWFSEMSVCKVFAKKKRLFGNNIAGSLLKRQKTPIM